MVYSFGSNNDFSFDDTIERYGCRVFTFDPSTQSHFHKRTENAYFLPTGLYHEDIEKDSRGWKMKKLSTIYHHLKADHGDVIIDYLKIDIEGAEWEVKFIFF